MNKEQLDDVFTQLVKSLEKELKGDHPTKVCFARPAARMGCLESTGVQEHPLLDGCQARHVALDGQGKHVSALVLP